MPLKWFLALAAVLCASGASALSTDHQQPVEIQADRVTLDEKKKISIYEGAVELVQGSLRVTAERIEVQRGGELEKVIAIGSPVTFRQQPDGESKEIRGEARRVEYNAAKPSLELSGEARLWQGDDQFSGARIVYEADRNVVRAAGSGDGGTGRIRATIHPSSKNTQPPGEKK